MEKAQIFMRQDDNKGINKIKGIMVYRVIGKGENVRWDEGMILGERTLREITRNGTKGDWEMGCRGDGAKERD